MKFTIAGHASLYVEGNGSKLLIDPWIVGSCYWRSWWNYPPPSRELVGSLDPDFIYLTHLHWDHYHGPSLRLFNRDKVTVLLPKSPTTRMLEDLKSFRFKNVVELPHGKKFKLSPGLEVTSYQFGPVVIDSALVVSDGKTVLLNANDTKFFGRPLRQIIKDYPKIDFVFRSHSSATPIPYCIEGYREKFKEFRRPEDYVQEFTQFSLSVRARYSIPFASNHCFLHRETKHYNETMANPNMVSRHFREAAVESRAAGECVVMPVGSSWSETEGFSIADFDFEKKEKNIQDLESRYFPKLQEQYKTEDATKANFKVFERYFTGFLRAVPYIFRKLFGFRTIFSVRDSDGDHHWLIDLKNARVRELKALEPAHVNVICSAFVINDCCRKRLFSSWGASKRLQIRLPGQSLRHVNQLFLLLDFYENDGLPIWKSFNARQLGVRLRRWREIVEIAGYVVKYKLLKRPLVIKDLYSLNRP